MVSTPLHVWLEKRLVEGKREYTRLVSVGEEMLPKLTVLIHGRKIFLCCHFTVLLILDSGTQLLVVLIGK